MSAKEPFIDKLARLGCPQETIDQVSFSLSSRSLTDSQEAMLGWIGKHFIPPDIQDSEPTSNQTRSTTGNGTRSTKWLETLLKQNQDQLSNTINEDTLVSCQSSLKRELETLSDEVSQLEASRFRLNENINIVKLWASSLGLPSKEVIRIEHTPKEKEIGQRISTLQNKLYKMRCNIIKQQEVYASKMSGTPTQTSARTSMERNASIWTCPVDCEIARLDVLSLQQRVRRLQDAIRSEQCFQEHCITLIDQIEHIDSNVEVYQEQIAKMSYSVQTAKSSVSHYTKDIQRVSTKQTSGNNGTQHTRPDEKSTRPKELMSAAIDKNTNISWAKQQVRMKPTNLELQRAQLRSQLHRIQTLLEGVRNVTDLEVLPMLKASAALKSSAEQQYDYETVQ